jgi:hypothetical protein
VKKSRSSRAVFLSPEKEDENEKNSPSFDRRVSRTRRSFSVLEAGG